MDSAAENFRTTEASVVWDQYQKVVDEHEEQKGKVYFRHGNDNEVQMAADITDPDQKYVLFNGSKIQVYQPKIDQVTVYNTGKNREAFESFLVLGFGGGGHDMLKSFNVKYLGNETVDGVEPKSWTWCPRRSTCAITLITSSSGSTRAGGFRCNSSFSSAHPATIAWRNTPTSR